MNKQQAGVGDSRAARANAIRRDADKYLGSPVGRRRRKSLAQAGLFFIIFAVTTIYARRYDEACADEEQGSRFGSRRGTFEHHERLRRPRRDGFNETHLREVEHRHVEIQRARGTRPCRARQRTRPHPDNTFQMARCGSMSFWGVSAVSVDSTPISS